MTQEHDGLHTSVSDRDLLDAFGITHDGPLDRHRGSGEGAVLELSSSEREILVEGGASERLGPEELSRHLSQLADQCRELIESSVNAEFVAEKLGVATESISAMSSSQPPQLHSFQLRGGQAYYPDWQFGRESTIPHLKTLLSALSPEVHPLAVWRFMSEKSFDLEDAVSGKPLSPRDWLLKDLDPKPVLQIANDL